LSCQVCKVKTQTKPKSTNGDLGDA